jgi:hypothetical protein
MLSFRRDKEYKIVASGDFLIPRGYQLSVFAPGVAISEYVRHALQLGGYEIIPNVKLKIDGERFVRTCNLRHQDGHEFRMIDPRDYRIITEPHPTAQEIRDYYGMPGACI